MFISLIPVLFVGASIGWYIVCLDTAIKQREPKHDEIRNMKQKPGESFSDWRQRRIDAFANMGKISLEKHALRLFLFREWQTLYE